MKGTDLKKSAVEGSGSLGRLPRGTVMTLTGQQKNGFVAVEVELNDGAVRGWVPKSVLNRSAREQLPDDGTVGKGGGDDEDDDKEEAPKTRRAEDDEEEVLERPRSRLRVPKDEGVLLHREDSFYYGVFGGGGVSLLVSDTATGTFVGPGFGGGAYAGYIFSASFAVQGEMGYAMFNGTDPAGKVNPYSFGFLSAEATLVYSIDRFELQGGLGYYYGLSLSNNPEIKVNGPADLSTITFHVGAALRFPLTEVMSLGLGGRYTRGLMVSPVGISVIKGMVFLQFRG